MTDGRLARKIVMLVLDNVNDVDGCIQQVKQLLESVSFTAREKARLIDGIDALNKHGPFSCGRDFAMEDLDENLIRKLK